MRIALIGAGRIGRMHARLLAVTEGVDELLVADTDHERASAVATYVGATAASSVDDALRTADAVVIAAATPAHAALIAACIDLRKPTFCEKPLGKDLASTLDAACRIEKSRIPFQLGFQRRFDPAYREARRLVQDGDLGVIYAFRFAGHDPAPPAEEYIRQSGGLFRDFSVHDFDILRWLTGHEVEDIFADGGVRGFPVFGRYDDVDTAVATIRMVDGPFGVLSAARHNPLGYDIRTELFGSRDSISVGIGPHMPLRSVEPGVPPPSGPPWLDFMDRFREAYADELRAFVTVATDNAESPCTARDGLEALRIAEAATKSLREHRPVRVAEIQGLPPLSGS